MPKKNGLEVTRDIFRLDKDAKIIIVSGDSTIKEKAIQCGALFFIEKLFNLDGLALIVRKVLEMV